MPVKLEHLTSPTEADWQDLNKIITETAPLGLNPSADDTVVELSQWLSNDRWVIGARFNDRIIGALLAERSDSSAVILSGHPVPKQCSLSETIGCRLMPQRAQGR